MPELCSTSGSYCDLPDPVSPPLSAPLSSYGLHQPSLLYLIGGHEEQSFPGKGMLSAERHPKRCHLWCKKATGSLSVTHAQKLLLWTQIRGVEPSTRCNSLHLLTSVLPPPAPCNPGCLCICQGFRDPWHSA